MKTVFYSLLLMCCSLLAIGAGETQAGGVTLKIETNDTALLKDGVFVGNLIMMNESAGEYYVPQYMFSVLAGRIRYHVKYPDGSIKIFTGIEPASFRTVQRIKLRIGEYVKKPICLMLYYYDYIFSQVGEYSIMAEFKDTESIYSQWMAINVTQSDDGYNQYINSHDFVNVIDAFRGLDMWTTKMAGQIDEFGDYSKEQAKLVIYNWSDGRVLSRIYSVRDKDASILTMANEGLEMARRYGIGIEMWEYIVDKIKYPESLQIHANGTIYPKNEYYF